MSFAFTSDNQAKFDTLLTRYPNKQAALLPTLWLAQKQHGYLPLDVQESVARMLGLSPVHVHGVVSFYTMFKSKPVGRYHLQVCRTLSCALTGCDKLVNQLDSKLQLKPGQVTTDGKFSLELVECLASCGTGPVVQVNETYIEHVTPEKLDELIKRLGETD